MPMAYLEKVNLMPRTEEERIGKELFDSTQAHVVEFLGQGDISLAFGACHAAVAIQPNVRYDSPHISFSVLYGNSRLFRALDPDFNGFGVRYPHDNRPYASSPHLEHAEQTAILTAAHRNLPFYENSACCHLYVDLPPCSYCGPWLQQHRENWYVHYYFDSAGELEKYREQQLRLIRTIR